MQLIKSIQNFAVKALGLGSLTTLRDSYTIQTFNQIYPTWFSYKILKAYKTIDIIYAVVTRLSKTAAAIPAYGYNEKGEDLADTDKFALFLRSITYTQKIKLYTWIFLRGECFIYKERTLGVNGQVTKMHFVNPSFVTLILTEVWPEEVQAYYIRDPQRGFELVVPKDDMIFISNFNPDDNYQLAWRGLSPVDVLLQRLTRMESNMRNSVSQMQNGGVPGVMYWKDIENKGGAAKLVVDAAKDNFARFLKNPENKGAPFMQAGDMGYFAIGSNLVDLNSLELEKIDVKMVCNVWGVSARLFNEDGTGSEISDDNAQEGLYVNAVIPAVQMVEDAFNTELVNDFGVGVRIIKHDFTGIWVLQKMLKDKIATFASSPVFIPNDVLEAMGYERNANTLFDEPLIKSGYVPIDSFEPLPPIE